MSDAGVLVIGAGPAGLATAACLKTEGVPFRLVDRRGAPGGAYRAIRPELVLASPRRYTALPGLAFPGSEYVSAGEVLAYLLRYAEKHSLSVERASVGTIAREGERFRADGNLHDAVVVATGMFQSPIRPAVPGLPPDGAGPPEVLHSGAWRGPVAGKRVLVVGGATSGIEVAEECARAGVPVTLAARGGVKIWPQRFLGRDLHDYAAIFEKLPRWFLGSHCGKRPTLPGTDLGFHAFVKEGKIRVAGALVAVEGRTAVLEQGVRLEPDTIVLATGYKFETPFLPPEVARAPAGHVLADQGESRSWPGLFVVGAPCARSLASEFLRGIADDAPHVARRIRKRLHSLREN